MTTPTITTLEAFTALCIWEAHLEAYADAEHPISRLRKAVGAVQARDQVIDIAPSVDRLWDAVRDAWEEGIAGAFDWEFVPFVARRCVTTSFDGCQLEMRHDAEELMRAEIAREHATFKERNITA